MTDTVIASRSRKPAPSAFSCLRPLTRAVNRPAIALAGSRLLPFWSLVRHRGRRSGKTFATPVAARRTADGFAIPLAFGAEADWCRNLLAAGGGVVRWAGDEYQVNDPVIVDAETAIDAFAPWERRVLRLIGLKRVVLVRTAPAPDATRDTK